MPMIEILPSEDFWRGSYNVPSVVDPKSYYYIHNEIFVEEWRQYIEKKNADPNFLKSKWLMEKSDSTREEKFNSLSDSEMINAGLEVKKFVGFRRSKKGKRFQKLVDEFDKIRNIITCYNDKFYTYTIPTSFADVIAVYMLDENDIAKISNALYFTLKKRARVSMRDSLLMGIEQTDDLE
jgi:hypothetical protein